MPTTFPENRALRYGHYVEIRSPLFDDMSMLTVAELVADPDLGLELVAGRTGAEREIEAAAVSELVNPGPWLQGGELLLTIGLLLPKTTDDLTVTVQIASDLNVPITARGGGTSLSGQSIGPGIVIDCSKIDSMVATSGAGESTASCGSRPKPSASCMALDGCKRKSATSRTCPAGSCSSPVRPAPASRPRSRRSSTS